MARKRAARYTEQSELFKNWQDRKGIFCPVCGGGFITTVETPKATIYVHSGQHLCQERHEIGTRLS